jgi:hypothetical protein
LTSPLYAASLSEAAPPWKLAEEPGVGPSADPHPALARGANVVPNAMTPAIAVTALKIVFM